MTREQIEKAAMLSCASKDEVLTDFGSNCFIEGAEWRINLVWHDASEELPFQHRRIIALYDDDSILPCKIVGDMKSCPSEWKRWAYVDDLLPKRKEEAE